MLHISLCWHKLNIFDQNQTNRKIKEVSYNTPLFDIKLTDVDPFIFIFNAQIVTAHCLKARAWQGSSGKRIVAVQFCFNFNSLVCMNKIRRPSLNIKWSQTCGLVSSVSISIVHCGFIVVTRSEFELYIFLVGLPHSRINTLIHPSHLLPSLMQLCFQFLLNLKCLN